MLLRRMDERGQQPVVPAAGHHHARDAPRLRRDTLGRHRMEPLQPALRNIQRTRLRCRLRLVARRQSDRGASLLGQQHHIAAQRRLPAHVALWHQRGKRGQRHRIALHRQFLGMSGIGRRRTAAHQPAIRRTLPRLRPPERREILHQERGCRKRTIHLIPYCQQQWHSDMARLVTRRGNSQRQLRLDNKLHARKPILPIAQRGNRQIHILLVQHHAHDTTHDTHKQRELPINERKGGCGSHRA